MTPSIILHHRCLMFTDKHGKLHNLTGPARIWSESKDFRSGLKEWWIEGEKVKEEYNNGTVCYYKNDKYHRLDGPAFIGADGTLEWWEEGKLIRDNLQ